MVVLCGQFQLQHGGPNVGAEKNERSQNVNLLNEQHTFSSTVSMYKKYMRFACSTQDSSIGTVLVSLSPIKLCKKTKQKNSYLASLLPCYLSVNPVNNQ